MEQIHSNSHSRYYLVQKFASIDEKGDGAWLSLKLFKEKKEAEAYVSSLGSSEKTRIIEVLCEATK
jgi:hypothetical protein